MTQVFNTQVVRDTRVKGASNAKTTTSRISNFTRMNPPTFFNSKVEEDHQGIIGEVFNVLDFIGVSSQEKGERTAYQLKYVAHVCYEK